MQEENILQTALENHKKPFIVELPTGESLVFTPEADGSWDFNIKNLTGKPLTVKGIKYFNTLDSFIDYTNKFKKDASNIYFSTNDIENVSVVAIINDAAPDTPDRGDFRLRYSPQLTTMAKTWKRMNGNKTDQNQFCSFLEQNAKDIVSTNPDNPSEKLPSSAEVLDFCANMEYTENFSFKRSFNEQDGRLSFIMENKAGNESKIMAFKKFAIAYTPFVGGDSFFVEALLKFRIDKNNGTLVLWFELQNMELVLEKAIESLKQKLHEGVGSTPIYYAVEPDRYI